MNKTTGILADLRAAILSSPAAELPSIRGQLAELQAIAEAELLARLFAQQPPAAVRPEDDGDDRLLTVAEAAQKLGQKVQWIRAHQDELPRVQLPGRTVRFSERKLETWLKRRTA